MSGTLDVRGLLQQAYFSTEVTNATQALEEAHKRFIDKHRSDGLSFELVVPGQPDAEWLREKVLRPLVYFCASRLINE